MDRIFYINVFCDRHGEIHYSSEEFSIYQNRIESLNEVLDDALRLVALEEWSYIGTLSSDAGISAIITEEMSKLRASQS
ncbi:MAG TPA: hypothetical protein VFT64_03615 [Rickettsiales bacterium]|nr:hypothetical protein [Rickettsiales bacterium]